MKTQTRQKYNLGICITKHLATAQI